MTGEAIGEMVAVAITSAGVTLAFVRRVIRVELENALAPLVGRILRLETDTATMERKIGKVLDA